MQTARTFPAPAKLNLFLHVTGRRADGFHELQTLFQLLDYGDQLTFTPRTDRTVALAAELPGVPAERDLVIRAARALLGAAPPPFGIDIAVEKRLPLGGGLGGGSSDAATTLVALNELWSLERSAEDLAVLGLALGADVPVFVHGHTAWAEGVGERLTPVDLPEAWFLVIHPGCAVATGEVFADAGLTRDTPRMRIADFSYDRARNDCEFVVRRRYPPVCAALDWLSGFSPRGRLTGTGACVFAPFESYEEAAAVAAAAPAGAGWTVFVARGVNRSPLLDALR